MTVVPGSAVMVNAGSLSLVTPPSVKLPIRPATSSFTWVITGTAGARLSSTRVLVASAAGLPATSLTLALTATGPLAQVLMSAICVLVRAQVPSDCTTAVTVFVCVVLTVSVSTTVTTWPGWAVVVPEMTTSLSSAALTMLSPSSVALIVKVGASVSISRSKASVAGLTLPATSVDVAVKAC